MGVQMQRDDVGGGPFAYYRVSAGTIHDAAADIDGHASSLDTLRRRLRGEHRRAMLAVEGELRDPMSTALSSSEAATERVVQASTFAAACVHLFGDFVHAYDYASRSPRSVALLNEAYADARLTDFGPSDDDPPGGAYADLIGPHGTLTAEYRRLEARLDVQAETVARLLRQGPNPEALRMLWALGAMPSNAFLVWPDAGLDDIPLLRLPPDLRDGHDDQRTLDDLADEDLMELGEQGFRPAGELFAERMAANGSSQDIPTPLDALGNLATLVVDPRACFGDDTSLEGCGIEALGVLPIGKPLKVIKAYRAARRLERTATPGPEIPPIHAGRQGKHIPGHPHFNERKSVLEADPHQLRKLAGTGTPRNKVPRGQPGFKEAIDYGFPIGRYVTDNGKSAFETTRAMLVYAKDGIHIYPIRPSP